MSDELPPLVEIAPGRWRVLRPVVQPARSDLPMPGVISDIMPATEQVDGRFYESKSQFRRVGRAHGLTEVGNEKPKPRTRPWRDDPQHKRKRRDDIARTVEEWKQGRRPKEE